MITYDYVCQRCRHEMEELVQNSDEIVICPKCGAKMTRLFTMPRGLITDSIEPGGFFSNQLNMHVEGRSHIKRELMRRGWGSEDMGISVRQDEAEKKPYRVAPDIVERETQREVIEEHGGTVTRKKYMDLKEKNAVVLSGNN